MSKYTNLMVKKGFKGSRFCSSDHDTFLLAGVVYSESFPTRGVEDVNLSASCPNCITYYPTRTHTSKTLYRHNQNKGAIREHIEQLCNGWKVVPVGERQGFAVICAP